MSCFDGLTIDLNRKKWHWNILDFNQGLDAYMHPTDEDEGGPGDTEDDSGEEVDIDNEDDRLMVELLVWFSDML